MKHKIFLHVGILAVAATSGCRDQPDVYASSCSQPLSHWGTEEDGQFHLRMVVPIDLKANGTVLWYDEPVSDDLLESRVRLADELYPQPQLIFEVAPEADCKRVKAVRKIMNSVPICKDHPVLCSEGKNWEDWPEYYP